MSADWTPPAEALKAAWAAYWEADTRGDVDVVAAALATAYHEIVAAERERIAQAIEAEATRNTPFDDGLLQAAFIARAVGSK